jgi:hypothetical protein
VRARGGSFDSLSRRARSASGAGERIAGADAGPTAAAQSPDSRPPPAADAGSGQRAIRGAVDALLEPELGHVSDGARRFQEVLERKLQAPFSDVDRLEFASLESRAKERFAHALAAAADSRGPEDEGDRLGAERLLRLADGLWSAYKPSGKTGRGRRLVLACLLPSLLTGRVVVERLLLLNPVRPPLRSRA